MIIGTAPTHVGRYLYLPLVENSVRKAQPRIPIDVVENALESDSAVLCDAVWGTGDEEIPVKVKVVRDSLAVLNSSSSVAQHESDAYKRLANREGIDHVARCFGIFEFSLEASTDSVTIFVLEKLGPSVERVARERPDLRGGLARRTLAEGLSAVLELSSVLVASRDPHPGNLVLVDAEPPPGRLDDGCAIRMIDLGTSYLMGGGREAISSAGRATGLLQVQPPAVVTEGAPHRGLVDDAFSVAVSAYMVASGGNSPYVRHVGESRSRVTWGKERDTHLWHFEPDYAKDLGSCSPGLTELITEIFESAGDFREGSTPTAARRLVAGWQRRAEGSATQTDSPDPSEPEPDTVPDPTRVLDEHAESAKTDEVVAAREWLKADRVKHVATRADFLPQFGRRLVPGVPPQLIAGVLAGLIVVCAFVFTFELWSMVFEWYQVLPTTTDTFAPWQTWAGVLTAAIAGIAGTLVVLFARRRDLPVRFVAGLGVAASSLAVGVLSIAIGSEVALAAAAAPLDCEGNLQPPHGSRISCVNDDLPEWWVADDPWVRTESEGDDGSTVAFNTQSLIGSNTGARISYPFDSELSECLSARLDVYQTPRPVEWGREYTMGEQDVTTTVLRSGADIARFADGRNTWEAYEWQDAGETAYSSIREYDLTSRGQESGLGTTLARLIVTATDCEAERKGEFDSAGKALLSKIELAPAATLDPSFVRLRSAESTISASDFSIPVSDEILPLYAWRWPSEGTWEAATSAMLTSGAGEFEVSVALERVPNDVASDGWISAAGADGTQAMYATFPNGSEYLRASIWVPGFEALDEVGKASVQSLQDGILVFGQRVEDAQ